MVKRRRSKGTWFPIFGQLVGIEGQQETVAGVDGQVPVAGAGGLNTALHVLTLDAPRETQTDDFTLADVLGSEYLLRRIVGKIFILNAGGATSPPFAKVTAGFFVARADPENSFYPLGAGTNLIPPGSTEAQASFSPLEQQTQREPWLWRRSWILGNPGIVQNSADPGSATGTAKLGASTWEQFPPCTAGYGSVLDGPHLDAKTLRRVGQDDRLYFAVSACRWPLTADPGGLPPNGNLVYHLDYRIFGSLRKAKQTGRF